LTPSAADWIKKLNLAPHPEGGYYRVTYASDISIPHSALPARFRGARPVSTAIYFLLDAANFSAFHRIQSDELWHFYDGSALLVHVIDASGAYSEIQLGKRVDAGEVFQAVVKAGCWFASRVKDTTTFALVGCTVAPGFDFEDFELAKRKELQEQYPQHSALIAQMTRS
jgi:uncharacterized protein